MEHRVVVEVSSHTRHHHHHIPPTLSSPAPPAELKELKLSYKIGDHDFQVS